MRSKSLTIAICAALGLAIGLTGGTVLAEAGRGLGAMLSGKGLEAALGSELGAGGGLSEAELLGVAFTPPATGAADAGLSPVVCKPVEAADRTVVSGPF